MKCEYEIVELQEKKVVGLSKRTTNQDMQAVQDIALVWQQFIGNGDYAAIENKADNKIIGLYTDYEGDFTKPYLFIACCEVSGDSHCNNFLTEKTIPAGKYAKFSTRGHIQQAVAELWQAIWKMNLDRLYTYDFEVYHHNSDDLNDQMIDIYIAIR
jgi:predicted transcriptional regulator YdeE